jgi:hypothetical protein
MKIEFIRALSNILSTRSSIASKAGLTFGGNRDIFDVLGYKKSITPEDYRERYKRNSVAKRVVTASPKATWRGGIELIEDEDPNTKTTFEKAWKELNNKFNVWSTLLRADILAGLGRFSVVLIGAPGNLDQELGRGELLYLSPFSEQDVSISNFVTDVTDERYGLAETYKFSRLGTTGAGGAQRDVHWSRVLHIADEMLDEQVYGTPRMECVWNNLDDLEKIVGGGSEAFWQRAHQGYQVNVDKDIEMEEGDMTDLEAEVDEFVHGMRRFARLRGAKIEALGSDVANFKNQVDSVIELISSGTGIPKRILMGSERGELASSQDESNWQDRIDDRRIQFAEPQVIRPFIDRLIEYSMLPKAEYEVRWPESQDLDQKEKAEVADKLAGLNKKVGGTVITAAEIRDRLLDLDPIEGSEELDDEFSDDDSVIIPEEPIKEDDESAAS